MKVYVVMDFDYVVKVCAHEEDAAAFVKVNNERSGYQSFFYEPYEVEGAKQMEVG